MASTDLTPALTRLNRARDLREALAPLERVLAEAGEEIRAAVIEAAAAGLSERTIAAKLNLTQPTVHGYLDGRAATPLPALPVADRVWLLHQTVQAITSVVHRLDGEQLPDNRSTSHVNPRSTLDTSRKFLGQAADLLGSAGASLEFAAATK